MSNLQIETNPSLDEQVETILSSFNFDMVRNAMIKMDLTWEKVSDGESFIPTIEELQNMATELLEEAAQNPEGSTFMGGGFHARKEQGTLSLVWVLTEAHGMIEVMEHSTTVH